MADKNWKLLSACVAIALAMAGCGGGGSDAVQSEPPAAQGLGKLERLTGKVTADLSDCHSTNGPAATAEYSNLLRATVYQDAVYLTETGEGCANVSYDISGFVPANLRPAIRKLSGGVVETAIDLNAYRNLFMTPLTLVRYPSGFQRNASTGDSFVLSYVAASSANFFALDTQEIDHYNTVQEGGWENGWTYYTPGLFRFEQGQTNPSFTDLVAGTPSQPPAYADGQGLAASFIAPHDLEMDASGLLYLIDQGQIRTIDAGYQVKTLDLAALGIQGSVGALGSDQQGHIHVLTRSSDLSFSWYRLADGSRVDFRPTSTAIDFSPGLARHMPFTVVGNDLILALSPGVNAATELYRISGNDGSWTLLTGTQTPATAQDLLDNPAQYAFPLVEDVEYGVDGNLYIVLQQGVLVARNFK